MRNAACLALAAIIAGVAACTPDISPTSKPSITCQCPYTAVDGKCVSPYENALLEIDRMVRQAEQEGEGIQPADVVWPANSDHPERMLPITVLQEYSQPEYPEDGAEYLFGEILTYEQAYDKYNFMSLDLTMSRNRLVFVTGLYQPSGGCSRGGYDGPVCWDSVIELGYFDAETGDLISSGMIEISEEERASALSFVLRCP